MNKKSIQSKSTLFSDIQQLIKNAKRYAGQSVNATLTLTYWNIGKRIHSEVLNNKRAEYGKQIVARLSKQLVKEFGDNYEITNLRRMIQFYDVYPDYKIVVSLIRQLSWTHFIALIPLRNPIQRDFYAQMCKLENWNVSALRQKIKSMLFERTAISKKPRALAKAELKQLANENKVSADLVFKDPYILDFLGLKDTFLENDLEQAILHRMEKFILELGNGFAFLERQKRMVIDGKDYHLDLLFYHRKLRGLVAVDLKIGAFEASYKGQMELYLRWLEKNEVEKDEDPPIGLILCAGGNSEQIELLQIDPDKIKIAQYTTQYVPKKLLKEKLHQFILSSQDKKRTKKKRNPRGIKPQSKKSAKQIAAKKTE